MPPGADDTADGLLFSVVVPSFETRDALVQCLRSLREQCGPEAPLCGSAEVIVVENASRDGSAAAAREAMPEARVLEQARNLGFAEGCNRGIEAARGSWIVLLNSDASVQVGWLEALSAAARAAAADVGMLQCRVLQQAAPDQLDTSGVAYHPRGEFHQRGKGRPADTHYALAPFCPSASAAVYRRSMLDTLALPSGVFDRRFFAYFEDVDLGWRARLAGFDVREVADARVLHTGHLSSAPAGLPFRKRLAMRNRVATFAKNASLAAIAGASPRLFRDLIGLTAEEGLEGTGQWVASAWHGWKQRGRVAQLARIDRRSFERLALAGD